MIMTALDIERLGGFPFRYPLLVKLFRKFLLYLSAVLRNDGRSYYVVPIYTGKPVLFYKLDLRIVLCQSQSLHNEFRAKQNKPTAERALESRTVVKLRWLQGSPLLLSVNGCGC